MPYQLCNYLRIFLRSFDAANPSVDLLRTPQSLSLLHSSAQRLLQESKETSGYSAKEKALLAAMAVSTLSLRICLCVVTVMSFRQPMPISTHEFLNSIIEVIHAWNQVLKCTTQVNNVMGGYECEAMLSAARVFETGSLMAWELLSGLNIEDPTEFAHIFTMDLNESENIFAVLDIVSVAASVHISNINATFDQSRWGGDGKKLEHVSRALLNLITVLEHILRQHNMKIVNLQQLDREHMYGTNAQAVWDAAWKATITTAKRATSIAKHPEPVVTDLHTPRGENGALVCSGYASAFLKPQQSTLAMMLLVSEAADAVKKDEQGDECKTAAMLLVCHALGRCPEIWKEYTSKGTGISSTGFAAIASVNKGLLEPCVMPADVEGLESALNSIIANRIQPEVESVKDGVLNLIQIAKDADVKDATRAIARAKILSHLPCGYLGCTAPGTIHGSDVGKNNRAKRCSGCLTMRYCSSSCQKADWKAHKIGCKAIATETAKEESPEEDA